MPDAAVMPLLVPIPYLPRVSWFVTLLSHSHVCWFMDERYSKKRPRNRCRIATSHGALELSVPLAEGRNQRQPLLEVKPLYNGKWQREHVHAIRTAYGRAPYFPYYADELFDILSKEHHSLAELNLTLIKLMLKQFKVQVIEAHDVATKSFEERTTAVIYRQVFSDKTGFVKDCSGIDLLFNHGPDSKKVMLNALVE